LFAQITILGDVKGARSAFAAIYIAKTTGRKGANRRFLEIFV
jgi:hypothetical protein